MTKGEFVIVTVLGLMFGTSMFAGYRNYIHQCPPDPSTIIYTPEPCHPNNGCSSFGETKKVVQL